MKSFLNTMLPHRPSEKERPCLDFLPGQLGVATSFLFLLFWAQNGMPNEKKPKEIHFGMVSNFSETSKRSFIPGEHLRNGIQLAVKAAQTRLQKKDLKIVLEEFDYGTSQLRVVEAAKKAVSSNVIGVIGYNYSSHALIAAPIHQSGQLPMITPSATANKIGAYENFIHQACFDNDFMGRVLARIAKSRLLARSILVIPALDCAYCQDLTESFEREFYRLQGNQVVKVPVLENDRNFEKVIEVLKRGHFDAILVPNQVVSSARIIAAINAAGLKKPFLGGDGWGNLSEDFFSAAGVKDIQSLSVSHWHSEVRTAVSQTFIKEYQNQFHKTPNDTAVLAYDSMNLMLEALLSAKTYDRLGLESALANIKDFNGITGHFVYRSGRAPEKSLVLLSSSQQKFKVEEIIQPATSE